MDAFNSREHIGNVYKFDGSNFTLWKFQVWLVLEQRDLTNVILGSELEPPAQTDDDGKITNEDAIKKWKQKGIATRAILVSTI